MSEAPALAPRKMKIRQGKVPGNEFFRFYTDQKRVAATYMLRQENFDSGGMQGSAGRNYSMKGNFDRARWLNRCGITRAECETIERAVTEWKRGVDRSIDEVLVEKCLTGLGRPDLYNLWYLDYALENCA